MYGRQQSFVAVQVCRSEGICADAEQDGWLYAVNDPPSISASLPVLLRSDGGGLDLPDSPSSALCTLEDLTTVVPGVRTGLTISDVDKNDAAPSAQPVVLRILLSSPGFELHFADVQQSSDLRGPLISGTTRVLLGQQQGNDTAAGPGNSAGAMDPSAIHEFRPIVIAFHTLVHAYCLIVCSQLFRSRSAEEPANE